MIYVKNPRISEQEFQNLLEQTKFNCLSEIQNNTHLSKMAGVDFENLVYKHMCIAAKGTVFEDDIEQTGAQTFPDIIAKKYYGTEVKATTDNKWISVGNSVAEGTRTEDVERIYMFFGKFGGGIDIKYRLYQACLSDIGVTHSPRYKIDMDLPDGESIFDKMGIKYDILRKEKSPILTIKSYYRKLLPEGEEPWWLDPQTENTTTAPSIRYLNKFTEEEKNKFIVESMILFPEIFSDDRTKFERPAAYLVTNYNAVTANLRDYYSAGGQVQMKIKGKTFMAPRIIANLKENAKNIKSYLAVTKDDKLCYYWGIDRLAKPKVDIWKERLDAMVVLEIKGVLASDVFESGLK